MNLFMQFKPLLKRKRALPLLAISGLLLLILMVKLQPSLQHDKSKKRVVAVSYISLQKQQIKPEITGFGIIEADKKLQAKAEVSGRIIYINPKLKKGEILAKDTLLLKIDDKDYLLQLKQAEADLLANKAQYTEMELNIENNELELKLALEKLTVRQTEYNRLAKLRKTGVVSKSNLNSEKQNLLRQQQEVLQLQNKKTTLPSNLAIVNAQLAIAQAKLAKSQRDLARTIIKMPFNGRISKVYTELDQYVSAGGLASAGQLFDVFSLNKVIINAQYPIDQFSLFAKNFNPKIFKNTEQNSMPSMSSVLSSLNLSATIDDPSKRFSPWQAKVERFSDNLDAKSRTVGVIVSVSNSYKQIKPGEKPPLLAGMYMQVNLLGRPLKVIAIPRFALHGQQVYLVDKNNQLKRVTLTNIQYNGELALIKDGLKSGDKLITSDVFPAIKGMLVTPIMDENVSKQMRLWLGKKGVVEKELGENQ
ncbi:MAG: hypothetical protein COB35_09205 [Gammaproteobacteria bacterium]|nr:MAG: hypothetical protein COB35_09205 [Gammaproteobacteria bacterium]